MKYRIFLIFIFLCQYCYGSQSAPSLKDILDCSHSVIHGKVESINFNAVKEEIWEEPVESKIGVYRVSVVDILSGKKHKKEIQLNIVFSAFKIGGLQYRYPEIGSEYLFIIRVVE